jgi:prepilin-type N-terminal cleavage/methylation domain-containing protein
MVGCARRAQQGVQKGYTIVELLVVVSIISLMVMAGVPFFTAMMQNSRLDAATRQLAGDVRDARSLATQTGWQYQIIGFNVGGGSTYQNQYRMLGRSSSGVAWPANTGPNFSSATQMAGPWINFNQLYPNVSLNPSISNVSFYVSFNSQGVAFEWNPTSVPWMSISPPSGSSRQLTITSAGSVTIQ